MQSTRTARQRLSGEARPASSGRAQQVEVPFVGEVSTIQLALGGVALAALVLLLISRGPPAGQRGFVIRDV